MDCTCEPASACMHAKEAVPSLSADRTWMGLFWPPGRRELRSDESLRMLCVSSLMGSTMYLEPRMWTRSCLQFLRILTTKRAMATTARTTKIGTTMPAGLTPEELLFSASTGSSVVETCW